MTSAHLLDPRLAALIRGGQPFTADDLTDDGRLALDPAHSANGKQNGIGSYLNRAAQRGLIEFTGRVERSRAPHRKGGGIRVWVGTGAGVLWAKNVTP